MNIRTLNINTITTLHLIQCQNQVSYRLIALVTLSKKNCVLTKHLLREALSGRAGRNRPSCEPRSLNYEASTRAVIIHADAKEDPLIQGLES